MTEDEVIAIKLSELKKAIPAIQKECQEILKADGGNLFPFDLHATAIAHRSCCLISGFCIMIEKENFICAAPLVRLHLDSLLRLYAGWLVSDPNKFATNVLKGEHVSNLKDRDGKKMYDNHLVKKMSEEYPWITSLYKETSGYVHFSHKHHSNTIDSFNDEERSIVFRVSAKDVNIPDGIREEAIDAMAEITKALLRYLYSWAYTKNNVRKDVV